MEKSDTHSESDYSDASEEKLEAQEYGMFSIGDRLLNVKTKYGK